MGYMKIYFFLIKFYIFTSVCQSQSPPYGQLEIQGRFLTDSQGKTVQLRGMSFFPSDYIGDEVADYFNEAAVHQIKCAWNANVVRAPTMPKEDKVGGWMTDKDRDYSRLKKVVDAAIKEGIYVIVDWHAFNDPHIDGAKDFFANISKTYGSFPNIIYEIWNEPDGENGTWPLVKEYAEEIIDTIRQNDPNNIIIVGTPNWSQRVDQAAQDPINLTNIAYTLHYYAASHGQPIRDIALSAINQGLPIFITEYGTVTYTGAGPMNESEANLWWEFDDKYQLSYVNWAIQNNSKSDANCCIQNTTADQLGDPSFWAPSGKLVNQKLRSTNQGVNCDNNGSNKIHILASFYLTFILICINKILCCYKQR